MASGVQEGLAGSGVRDRGVGDIEGHWGMGQGKIIVRRLIPLLMIMECGVDAT